MHAEIRPSSQIRAAFPEMDESPHPRACEMAEAMREFSALGNGGPTFRDLIREGFTSAEITEHHRQAEQLANERGTRQIRPEPDRLAELVAKAVSPLPNRLPLPAGTAETQALFQAWGQYCAARGSHLLDPWSGQRERCLDKLRDYLNRLPLHPRSRKDISLKVAAALQASAAHQKVAQ
ncbi:hypothetical protein [Aminobacter niigataensis]|uniref:hypothetical protein n=1 Tax=Aminobacter niigataensis TaxID=83265 RepID=UPI0024C72B49|nr:hypothetical protein [Aminobacter niigataensis]CAI2936122.1 conserved protein of unknown function [Aminobacter niigataensis]